MNPNVWIQSCASASCVQARRSFCSDGACVEAEFQSDKVLVRNSTLGSESPILTFSVAEWNMVLSKIRGGYWEDLGDDDDIFTWKNWGSSVQFTGKEIREFVAGVKAGMFDFTAEDQ